MSIMTAGPSGAGAKRYTAYGIKPGYGVLGIMISGTGSGIFVHNFLGRESWLR